MDSNYDLSLLYRCSNKLNEWLLQGFSLLSVSSYYAQINNSSRRMFTFFVNTFVDKRENFNMW